MDYFLCTLQEHQTIPTYATISKDSNFGVIMAVYEKFFFAIFKYYREIRKCMVKIIL